MPLPTYHHTLTYRPMLAILLQSLRLAEPPVRKVSQVPGVSSGIHVLPDDVLQELFEWIVRDTQPTIISASTSMPPQLTLASVCRRWRVVITSLSYLWNDFILDCVHFGGSQALPNRQLGVFLRWSRELPISLDLIGVDRENLFLSLPLERTYGQLLDVIVPHYRRWKNIKIVLDHSLTRRISYIIDNPLLMENLESLIVDFRTRYWFDQDPYHIPASLVTSMIRFPKLERFDFRTCSPWSYIPKASEVPYWEKLTHLSIHVSYGLPHLVGLKLLQYLTSAVFIRMNVTVLRQRADGMTREVLKAANSMRKSLPEQIVLSRVQELILSVDHEEEGHERVLDTIVAPNMETLALSLDPVSNYDGKQLLREARRLVEAAPKLKTVYIRLWGSQYFEVEDVIPLIWTLYEKSVSKIDIAGDHAFMLPELWKWVRTDEKLAAIMTFISVQGMCKFDNLK